MAAVNPRRAGCNGFCCPGLQDGYKVLRVLFDDWAIATAIYCCVACLVLYLTCKEKVDIFFPFYIDRKSLMRSISVVGLKLKVGNVLCRFLRGGMLSDKVEGAQWLPHAVSLFHFCGVSKSLMGH